MSLSRAFTTRRLRMGSDAADGSKAPHRSNTTKAPQSLRHKISAPVQLIHTTNMLSYNAPDIPRSARSNSTAKSEEDFDIATAESTPPTSPDVAPGERSCSPEPNHLSSYFMTSSKHSTVSESEAPAIPKRSPSHTKKNSYEAIARQRSISRMSRDSEHSTSTRAGQTFSRSASTSTRASSSSHTSSPHSLKQTPPPTGPLPAPPVNYQKEPHPFGQELAQVTELAEEYSAGGLDAIDEEDQYLNTRSLVKWSADDYLCAIQGLSLSIFGDSRNRIQAPAPLWI